MLTSSNEEEMYWDTSTPQINENRLDYQSSSLTSKFLSVLRPFNVSKLSDLNMLIHEAISIGNPEIFDCYQYLVEDIFSTEKETNWNLFISSNSLAHQNEFNSLYSFLNANGNLFNLIKFLMTDSSLKSFYPVSKLPMPSRLLIEQGITPNFYLNKVRSDSISIHPTQVQLNPFEFFFVHFAHYVKNLNTIHEFGANEQISILYLNLLESYLSKFLPTSNDQKCLSENNTSNTQNSIWQSLSSTTSNLLHLGQQINARKSPNNQDTTTSFIQKPSLLNIKPLQNYSFKQIEESVYNQKSFDSLSSTVYKCETLINLLTEMWLNIKVPATLTKKQIVNQSNLISNNCPNVLYMMCVRVFIKRIHYFANSQTDKSLEMGNMPAFDNHELDEIKKSVWTSSKYQIPKRFYSFIKLSFEHWPCDSSFRMPLETWLSYIQPWRYLQEIQTPSVLNNSANQSNQLINLKKWKPFIQENVLFYTTIYKAILYRFINLDLLSLKNANMLYRICKVFTQLDLSDLIRETESNCDTVVSTSWLASASLRGSLLSPNLRNNSQSTCKKDLSFTNLLEDNEKTEFVYASFFSEEVKKSVIELMRKVRTTTEKLSSLESALIEKNEREKSQITEFFSSFFATTDLSEKDEKADLEEMTKTRNLLEMICSRFAQLYEIDLTEISMNDEQFTNLHVAGDRVDASGGDQSTLRQKPSEVSPLVNQFSLHKIDYNGNPDLQPVRTFEFYYLVMFFIYLSDLINSYYRDTFERLYSNDGLAGWFARCVLSGPHEYTIIEKNGIHSQKRLSKRLPPRLNLRPLSSKVFYAYLFFVYIFFKMFLFSKILSVIVLFTSVCGIFIAKL